MAFFVAYNLNTQSLLYAAQYTQTSTGKIKIEKLDDLPPHSYKVKVKAVNFLTDDKALLKLAKEVRKDLEADLKKYDIQDKTTLKEFYGNLGMIAILEKRYDDYLQYLSKRKELEDKESSRLMTGIFTLSYVEALKSGTKDLQTAVRENYTARVNALPYEIVEADLKAAKGQAEISSQTLIAGFLESRIQPILDQSGGEISKDIALTLISSGYSTRHFIPYKDIIVEVLSPYLAAHEVKKPDIWAEREVTLADHDAAHPVVVAIWDSGTDTQVFPGRLFVNPAEIPQNGVDDDNNGYVDDVHGIAYDLHADKTPELLYPIGDVGANRPRLQRLMKGLTDLSSNIESEESAELKGILAGLEQAQVKPFIEDINQYANYCHGTHVAGIAAQGNPFARLLPARLTFGHTLIPECPTIEQARKDSLMMIETVAYFKAHGVRVVNMSWGNSLDEIRDALEANAAGGSPQEQKELTRKIFEIERNGLWQAIQSAPEILFITSAGNADNDVNFAEYIPSSFDLPHILSVGAVDQAGEETDFTSFGKVDVYANGFEVLSCVPGGDQMKLSGTSMSSPNVTNLAAKLFALRPDLTPIQVRTLIEKGCDIKQAGDRTVKLINPKKSMELLMTM